MSTFYAQYPESASAGANASVGVNGATAPTSSTEIAGVNNSGNLTPVSVDNAGNVNVNTTGLPTSLGQKTMANSTSIAIASDQTAGALASSALQTSGNSSLSSIDGKTPALGQAVMASSSPVVIASNQTAIPVTAASLPLPSGAATEATLSSFSAKSSSSDVHEAYDYRAFTYVGATQKIATITYKTGGSGGSTVATQTFGYDGSDRLTSITKT